MEGGGGGVKLLSGVYMVYAPLSQPPRLWQSNTQTQKTHLGLRPRRVVHVPICHPHGRRRRRRRQQQGRPLPLPLLPPSSCCHCCCAASLPSAPLADEERGRRQALLLSPRPVAAAEAAAASVEMCAVGLDSTHTFMHMTHRFHGHHAPHIYACRRLAHLDIETDTHRLRRSSRFARARQAILFALLFCFPVGSVGLG